jgi:biopolymer transport protein ExbD
MEFPKYSHKKARIEIVPMIDTIFFLLVYFMIASLSMTHVPIKDLALPESSTATQRQQAVIIVTIGHDGRCYLDQKQIVMDTLKSALTNKLAHDSGLTVVINCDKDQPVSIFDTVFDLVKQANPVSVMVATTPGGTRRTIQ